MTTRTQGKIRIWTAAAAMAILTAFLILTGAPDSLAQQGNDPDSTRADAVNLGDITAQHKAKGKNHSIDGVNDVVDYFSFSLTATREVMVKLKEMERNADLFIEDQDGNELASSTEAGTADDAIFHELDAGTYYIRVEAMQRGSNIYKLRYKATEPVEEDSTPANVAATGAPAISGTAQVGETLTADTSSVSDQNGLTNPAFAYQWLRDDSPVSGSTGQEYTLTADDVGSRMKVRVDFVDDDGHQESLTSAATAEVTRPANMAATGQPTITGTEQVGGTLTSDISGISDQNGLENAQFAYQWIRNEGNADSEISGATGTSHELTTNDLNHTIRVKVSFTDDDGYEETATSAATGTVSRPADAEPTGQPTITGTAEVGETLTADTSGISDANGLSNPGFTYQWVRSGANPDAQITGATGPSYTVAGEDAGNSLKVTVSFTDDHGYAHSLTSSPTPPVGAGTGTGPGLTPSFLHNDDCTGDTTTTCILTLGGHFDGNIHNPNSREYEEDWVKLEDLTTGRYRFRLAGRGSNPSPELTMIIRKEGRSPGTVADGTHIHHFVAGNDAGVAGTPTDVYIEVRGENGDYRLSVERLSYIEPSGADLASGTATAGWLEVGYDPYPGKSGNISSSTDQDAFRVNLEAGKNYRIDVKGSERTDYGGTAPDTIMSLTMPDAASARLLNPTPGTVTHIEASGVLSQAMIATGGGRGANARLDIHVNTSGQFLIEASDSNSTGTYTVTVKELTFPARGTAETGYLQVNGTPETGSLPGNTQIDTYLVKLNEGRTYRIEVWGDATTDYGGTLEDPTVSLFLENFSTITNKAVVDNPFASTSFQASDGIFDQDSGVGRNARLMVHVYAGGTYLVGVTSVELAGGTYTLFIQDEGETFPRDPRGSKQSVSEPTNQDMPNFLTSTGYVQVNGDGATGRIQSANDQDVFAVRLEGNTQYRIEVWGDDATEDGGSLADPKFTVRNPAFDRTTNGSEIEHIGFETWEQWTRGGVKDNDSGSGKNASVDVAPNWPGRTFYIQVGSQDGGTGTYTVFVTETGKNRWRTPTPMVQGLGPVHSYRHTSWEPPNGDFPNDTTTEGWVRPDGSRAHGEIENFDVDYFKAKLVSGYSYRIDMKGGNNSEPGGTLESSFLKIKDRNGRDIGQGSEIVTPTLADRAHPSEIGDLNSGSGHNARLELDIKETQTYHVHAGRVPPAIGTYTVQLTILGKHGHTLPPQGTTKTKSEGGTDLPGTTGTTGFVRPSGDPATGNIQANSDVDAFKVRFLQGHRYRIDVNGAEATDRGGTLEDPRLRIVGANGLLINNTNDLSPLNFKLSDRPSNGLSDSDSGAGNNPKIVLHASATGTYYLYVDENGNDATGTYTIQVTALEDTGVRFGPQGSQETVSEIAGQDLSDSRTATTGRIQPSGDPATGEITPAGDEDAFTFKVSHNAKYRIDVKGSGSSGQGGTLADPEVLLIGPSGITLTETLGFISLTTGQYTSEGVVDNDSGQGRNARLVFRNLLSGTDTYTIRVREHGGDATGTYTVVITRLE